MLHRNLNYFLKTFSVIAVYAPSFSRFQVYGGNDGLAENMVHGKIYDLPLEDYARTSGRWVDEDKVASYVKTVSKA